ncbi:MAG: GNAT family N-acetyltransferase [Planctomycetota bacterium]
MTTTSTEAFEGLELREARDDDAADLIALIGRCFAEYPGVLLDVEGEMPELLAIATTFAKADGRFWVVVDPADDRVIGCVGGAPASGGKSLELKKLYVSPTARRRGLGRALCGLVEEEARARGLSKVELWSDTKFTKAHQLYRSLGYEDTGQTRELEDISDTVEYYFVKPLS